MARSSPLTLSPRSFSVFSSSGITFSGSALFAVSAVATVTVQDRILSVQVVPGTLQVAAGDQSQFLAMVTTACGTFAAQ